MKTNVPLFYSLRKAMGVLAFCCVAFSSAAQTVPSYPNELTSEDKLFTLSKFWSEVKYNFVYFNQIGEEKWDSIYRSYIGKVQETRNDQEFYNELRRMCALLKDGHTNIYWDGFQGVTTFFDTFQWNISNIDGKAIVTRINEMSKDKIPVGTEIVKVNGMPTREYIEKYSLPLVSSSTDYVRWDQATSLMLQSAKGVGYDIELLTPDKRTLNLHITHEIKESLRSDPMYPKKEKRKLLELKWYPNDIAYVALNSFSKPEINKMFADTFPELKKRARKLIIDLRANGGGSTNVGAEILKYLTPDSILQGSAWYTRVYGGSYAAWGGFRTPKDTVGDEWAKKSYLMARGEYFEGENNSTFQVEPEHERLVVPTVLLIDHYTASAAEDFLILADKQKHMTKIGRHSFGSTGQPIFIEFGKGFSARICTKKDTYPDGRMFVGCGVKPDIEVVPTVQDFIDNKDSALQTALEYLKKQK